MTALLVTRNQVLGSDLPSHPGDSQALQHMNDGIQKLPRIQGSDQYGAWPLKLCIVVMHHLLSLVEVEPSPDADHEAFSRA